MPGGVPVTARAIADAIRAALEASLRQLPAGATVADAFNDGAISAAANNAAQALVGRPVDVLLAALEHIPGARAVTMIDIGTRVAVDISCVGEEACADIAAMLEMPEPIVDVVQGVAICDSTAHRDRAVVTVRSSRVVQPATRERAA